MQGRTRLIYFFILGIGLAVRCALPFLIPQNPAKGDGGIYVMHTENLKYFGIYSSQQAEFPEPTFDHMPGMPFYLAAILWVTGRESPWAILPTLLCGWAILIVLGAVLKELKVPPKIRLGALAFYAVLPILDYYALQFYPEVPAALLTLLGFYFILRLKRVPKWTGALWAGLFLTLAVFFRPELILNFAVAGLGLWFADLPLKKILGFGGIMAGVLILFLIPWTVRNYQVSGEFVFLAKNHAPGTTLSDRESPGWEENRGCAQGLYLWLNTWHTTEKEVKMAAWDFLNADLNTLPDRAFASAEEKAQLTHLQTVPNYTCGIDAEIEQLARKRIQAHPFQFYVGLPLQRCFHLLFRTQRFDSLTQAEGPGFWMWLAYALACNLIVGLGMLGAILIRKRPKWIWILVVAIGLRLVWFAWFYHVEYRYMLLYFPLFFILAAYFCFQIINRRITPNKK